MIDIDKMLKDLEEFNKFHDSEINPTKGERDLLELREAVAKLKAEREAKSRKNKEAMKVAVDKSNNIAVDKYVAAVENRKKEFKENYF